MSIKNLDLRPTKKRAIPENSNFVQNTKSSVITDYFKDQLSQANDFTQEAMLLERGAPITSEQAFEYYRSNAAVATAVDMISDGVSQIRPMEKKDGDIVGENTENIRKLMHPNGIETWTEFSGKIAKHYLLVGNAFASLHGSIRRPFPTAMFVARPQCVHPQTNSVDEFAEMYNVTSGVSRGMYTRSGNIFTGDIRYVSGKPQAELIHLKRFSSRGDDMWGDSPLTAAAIDTKQQIAGRIHNLGMLENGARPSMMVNLSGLDSMTTKPVVVGMDELRKRSDHLKEQLSGKHNAGKIVVTTGAETKYQELGTNNKDMDYTELDKISSEAIFRRYQVPLPLVMNQSATYNNVVNAIAFFIETTVLPLADVIFAWMTRMLRIRGVLDDSTMISYSPETIPALMSKKLDEIKKRREIGVETVNEIRESLPGRESVEGGDVVYQPSTMIPIDEMGMAGMPGLSDDNGASPPVSDSFEAPPGVRSE